MISVVVDWGSIFGASGAGLRALAFVGYVGFSLSVGFLECFE